MKINIINITCVLCEKPLRSLRGISRRGRKVYAKNAKKNI